MDSILTSIKKMLGITEECTDFDSDIILSINTALAILTQLGVGPTNGLVIGSKSTKWSEFIASSAKLETVKSYVHFKVRLLFDPPSSNALIESISRMLSELEWRILVQAEDSIKA